MRLTLSESLQSELQTHLPQIEARLAELVPRAEFHHIGATAIPGAITKGDVDVLLRVAAVEFPHAIEVLKAGYETKQPQNWTESFASFGDDSSFPFPLGIQLVIRDSGSDIFLLLHEYFSSDAAHLAEYNRIKTEHAPMGAEEYWKAKNRFLSHILESRSRDANRVAGGD